jgi:hypothetical protein
MDGDMFCHLVACSSLLHNDRGEKKCNMKHDPSVTEHTYSGQNIKQIIYIRKRTLNSSVIKAALCAVGFRYFISCFLFYYIEMAKRTTS